MASNSEAKDTYGEDMNSEVLYPEILATVVLCYSLTTFFTTARLVAKRSYSSWTLEDCMYRVATRRFSLTFVSRTSDVLALAWVSTSPG